MKYLMIISLIDDELLGKAVQLKEEEKNKTVKKDKRRVKRKKSNEEDVF